MRSATNREAARILVVDDDGPTREHLREALEAADTLAGKASAGEH